MPTGAPTSAVRAGADYQRAAPWLLALLGVAAVAFWPTYLALPLGASSGYTHAHAVTAALWMALLVVQPWLIARRRRDVHRTLGRASYVLAPAVLLSIVLLANHRIRYAPENAYALQTYILYLQLSLALLFGGLYVAAIASRRTMWRHARLMVATALTLIDPIAIRFMFWAAPEPTWNYQWATFGLTDVVLLALLWRDRHDARARRLWVVLLAIFVALQSPALFGGTDSAAWQAFARWYAGLPLT